VIFHTLLHSPIEGEANYILWHRMAYIQRERVRRRVLAAELRLDCLSMTSVEDTGKLH
jgi:hypothetical protein